jgi:plastocyanin
MRLHYIALLPLLVLPAAIGEPEAAPSGGTVTGTVAVFDKGKLAQVDPDDVWVYLMPELPRGKQAPKPKAVTTQIRQCNETFVPHTVVVPIESIIEFPNNEKNPSTEHNVFSPTSPIFDLGKYGPPTKRSRSFMDDGEFDIYCDIHRYMEAKVKVVETEASLIAKVVNGKFTLTDVPPGDYKVVAWVPNSAESKTKVTVVAGSTVTAAALKVQLGPTPAPHNNKSNLPYKGYSNGSKRGKCP